MIHIERSTKIEHTPRLDQLRGMFDLKKEKMSSRKWSIDVDLDSQPWNVGLIVGPSGCGKSTIASELFGGQLINGYDWPANNSIVDAFPESLSIKEITGLLSSVGFSSPPSWVRPFAVLSNGEQFRVMLARALAENTELAVIDEFTSVVDRTVAQIGSAAVAKAVRKRGKKFIAVACHYDIIDWLDPDWILEPDKGVIQWRLERQPRPEVELSIFRTDRTAWEFFRQHHYLSHDINKSAKFFVGKIAGRPACFAAVTYFPHPIKPSWKEHRLVVSPDFQGIGLGNKMSEFVASVMAATGTRYVSTTSHPALTYSRAKSPNWKITRRPAIAHRRDKRNSANSSRASRSMQDQAAFTRMTAGFLYCGSANLEAAKALGVIQ